MGTEQRRQGFQVEAAVHEQLRPRQLRRKIELAPQLLGAGSEDRFGLSLVAVKIAGNFEDAIEIGAGTAIFAMLLCFAQRLAHQVLSKNGLFLMRLVLWSAGLEIEAQGTAVRICLKSG